MLDFQALKERLPITDAVRFLNLETREQGGTLRAACPRCNEGGDRAIAINPTHNKYYCFAAKRGGDLISLVAHVHGISQRQAAEALQNEYFGKEPPKEPPKEKKRGFDAQAYLASLQPVDGLAVDLCIKVGIGKALKGAHAGKVVVALRDQAGSIIVFASVTDLKLPSKW